MSIDMIHEILNRASRADAYVKDKLSKFKDGEKYDLYKRTFQSCEKYLSSNQMNTLLIGELDAEIRLQYTINQCLNDHLQMTELEIIKWEEDTSRKSRKLVGLIAELKIN